MTLLQQAHASGKVRAMMDDRGTHVSKKQDRPHRLRFLVLDDVPNAGEILMAFPSDKEGKKLCGRPLLPRIRNTSLKKQKARLSLDDLFNQIQAGNLKELPYHRQSRCTGFCRSSETES